MVRARVPLSMAVLALAGMSIAGCSSVTHCNTSESATPHIVVTTAARSAADADMTVQACQDGGCTTVAAGRRSELQLDGSPGKTTQITVIVRRGDAVLSDAPVDVSMRQLNADGPCGSGGSNIAGAITVDAAGHVQDAPDQAR